MSTRTFNVCSICKTQWAKKPAKRSAVFKAVDSVGSNWVRPNREGNEYLRAQCVGLRDQALHDLQKDLEAIASGSEVLAAKVRQNAAMRVLIHHSKD